ncbi:MAG: hypothetical protein H6523_13015 [Mycolicibacterium sp.]|nr:hypothetical protein [Mycolicibacterium sp.]
MSDSAFTAGYLAGSDHRTTTADDREAEGDFGPDDGYRYCPAGHLEADQSCDWCAGWAAAWD